MTRSTAGRFEGPPGVHWRAFGSGPEPALLLHCALAHSGAWWAVADRLAGRFDMVAPDMPGHGRSADWDGRGDYHDAATANAAAFLQDGATVIGHSFGATVALRLAQQQPARVARLVLIEPVLFAAAALADPAAFDAHRAATAPFAAALGAGDHARAAALFIAAWGEGPGWTDLPEHQRAGLVARMPLIAATDAALSRDTAGLLRPDALESLTMPVLLLRGDRTMPVMRAIHEALAARIPQARDEVVAGAGHMLPLTHPKAAADAIAAVR